MADLGVLRVQVVPDLEGFESQVSSAMRGIGGAMAGISRQVAGDLVNIGTSLVTAGAIGIGLTATVGIKMAASLETAQLQFQTLLGSADAAKVKVQELFDFAKRTPFESGPVIEASRRMQVFGGNALNTADNLERIGNAAATVSAPIEDVAFWVGRAYSQIQGGLPFGEAAMRLQELGVVGPETTNQMKELVTAGGSADDVFKLLTDHLDGFGGAMERQSQTWTGLISTIKDQFALGAKDAFLPLFDTLKALETQLANFLDSPVFSAITRNFAELVDIILQGLAPAISGISNALGSLTETDVDRFFLNIREALASVVDVGGEVLDAFDPLIPVIGGVALAFLSVKASAIPLVGLLFPQITGLTGALLGLFLGIEDNRNALMDFGKAIGGAARDVLPQLEGAVNTIADVFNDTLRGALDAIRPAVEELIRNVLPALANMLAQLAPALGRVVVELAKLASGVIVTLSPTIVGIADAFGSLASAGLDAVADLLGVVNDHLETLGPLLGAVALVFAGFKLANFISELGLVKSAVQGVQTIMGAVRTSVAEAAGTGFFNSIKSGAMGAAGAVTSLTTALATIGVTLVVAGFVNAFQQAQKRAQEFKDTVQEISGVIQEFGEGAGARQLILGFLHEGAGLGEEFGTAVVRLAGGMGNLNDKLGESQENWDAFINRLAAQPGVDEFVIQSLNKLRREYEGATEDADRAAEKEMEQQQVRADSKTAIDNQTQALQDLRDAMDEALNRNLSVAQSEVALRDSLAGMSAQVQQLAEDGINVAAAYDAAANSFDLTTEAGRRGSEIVTDNISQFQQFEQSVLDSGASADVMRDQLNSLYGELVHNTAVAFNTTDAEAAEMLATFGLTPDKLTTDVDLKSEQAQSEAEELARRLNNLPGVPAPLKAQIDAAIQAGDLDTATALLDGWEAKYRNDPPTVEVKFQVDYSGLREADRQAALFNRQNQGNVNRSAGAQGTPMMGPAEAPVGPMALQADRTVTMWLRPRVYTGGVMDTAAEAGAQQRGPVLIENRVFLGDQEVKQLVRQETRVMDRDRSLAFIGGTP